MTFSLVGMCRRTGMFGAAVTTSSMGVGSRCPFARTGVGAVLTQHRTDPLLGPRGIELLAQGQSAAQVIEALTADNPTISWRQLAVIDARGDTAYYHGDKIRSIHAAAQGDAVCAIGNIIRQENIPQAMLEAFAEGPGEHLAERLLRGLEAGGELQQVKSAALLVVHEQPFPLVDLRVELDPQPLPTLRFLWELYRPQTDLYVRRAVDPDSIPYPET
ncbi:MAG: DUF1028 domain-containing protein [bacterium]|nr:DUF1028 domain-containing protein [bacterium]